MIRPHTHNTYCTHAAVGPQVLGRNCRFLQGPDTDPKAVEKIRKASASASARERSPSLPFPAGRYVLPQPGAAADRQARSHGHHASGWQRPSNKLRSM